MNAQLYTELRTRVLSGHYIKAKQVVQNNAGNLYMIPYYDNGIFRLTVFNKDKDLDEININEILKIDNTSRPNHGLPDPMMNACFIQNDNIIINVYHTHTSTMWHFSYNFIEKKTLCEPI